MSMPTPRRSAMAKIGSRWPSRVAVDADRIEATQKVGALGDGGVEQVGRARRAQDAALREGHDLDGDQVAKALPHFQDLVEIAEAELVVDVDMAAHVQRAGCHHLPDQSGAGLGLRNGTGRTHLALRLDAIANGVAGRLVRHPGQAEQVLSRWMRLSTSGGRTRRCSGRACRSLSWDR
jgi:hypothetical protein